MSTEVTVVATSAISAAAAIGGAWIGLLAGRQQIRAEDGRQREQRAQARRDERKVAYGVAIDLITDWLWDVRFPSPGYDVLASFTKPFVHAANAVRIYGSDGAYKAVERFQGAMDGYNELNENPDPTQAEMDQVWREIFAALDEIFGAARADVGPAAADFAKRLRAAPPPSG